MQWWGLIKRHWQNGALGTLECSAIYAFHFFMLHISLTHLFLLHVFHWVFLCCIPFSALIFLAPFFVESFFVASFFIVLHWHYRNCRKNWDPLQLVREHALCHCLIDYHRWSLQPSVMVHHCPFQSSFCLQQESPQNAPPGKMPITVTARLEEDTVAQQDSTLQKNTSKMLVAPQISKGLGLPWSALVCYSLPWLLLAWPRCIILHPHSISLHPHCIHMHPPASAFICFICFVCFYLFFKIPTLSRFF